MLFNPEFSKENNYFKNVAFLKNDLPEILSFDWIFNAPLCFTEKH